MGGDDERATQARMLELGGKLQRRVAWSCLRLCRLVAEAMDPTALCVVAGAFCWKLQVDVVVLSDEGGECVYVVGMSDEGG